MIRGGNQVVQVTYPPLCDTDQYSVLVKQSGAQAIKPLPGYRGKMVRDSTTISPGLHVGMVQGTQKSALTEQVV